MRQNAKMTTGGLVLAGLAAFAWYKYSRMSEDQKRNMVGDLKEKGKKLYDQYMPEQMKNMFGHKDDMNMHNTTTGNTSHTTQGGYA